MSEEFRLVYRLPKKGKSAAEEVLGAQAVMEEFMSGSVRSTFERYEEKLAEAQRAPRPEACALCDGTGLTLRPLSNSDSAPIVCEDCGVDYWLAVQWVYPPAVMMDRSSRKEDG